VGRPTQSPPFPASSGGREVSHSHLSSTEVRNECSHAYTPPVRRHGVDGGNLYLNFFSLTFLDSVKTLTASSTLPSLNTEGRSERCVQHASCVTQTAHETTYCRFVWHRSYSKCNTELIPASYLTHWGRVTQICVFNTRSFSLHNTLNHAIHRACLRMVLLTDVYRNLTSLWINL